MKSIIFYGTYTKLYKNIIKIKSNNYYSFKNTVIEDTERIKGYTSMDELENVIKDHTKKSGLDKEYFIKNLPENLSEEKNWYVFEYELKPIETLFTTNAKYTINSFLTVKNERSFESESNSDSYDKDDDKYN